MKFPIIIVANYRSGSTAFATGLAKKLGLPYHLEPYQPRAKPTDFGLTLMGFKADFFHQIRSGDSKFLLKIMPDQIYPVTPYDIMLRSETSYKIKLYREDVMDNIVSQYVAMMSGKWWNTKQDKNEPYVLDIDLVKIKGAIHTITYNNYLMNTLNYEYDEIKTYESLELSDEDFIKTAMPENINEVREEISKAFYNFNKINREFVESKNKSSQ